MPNTDEKIGEVLEKLYYDKVDFKSNVTIELALFQIKAIMTEAVMSEEELLSVMAITEDIRSHEALEDFWERLSQAIHQSQLKKIEEKI